MTSAEAKEIRKLQAVVGAWYEAGRTDKTARDNAAEFRDYFPVRGDGDPSRGIKAWLQWQDKRRWTEVPGFFRAMPITTKGRNGEADRTLWPLVTFQFRVGRRLQTMIRVVLCAENAEGLVDGWGWRFDSPDEDHGDDSHPYAHVQHITTWERGSQGFTWPKVDVFEEEDQVAHPAESRKTIPETKPAVPIACSDVAGVAVAAMMSLYGPKRTAAILKGISQGDDAFHRLSGLEKIEVLDRNG